MENTATTSSTISGGKDVKSVEKTAGVLPPSKDESSNEPSKETVAQGNNEKRKRKLNELESEEGFNTKDSVDEDASDESTKKKAKKEEQGNDQPRETVSAPTKPRGTRGSLSEREKTKSTKRTGEKRISPASSATNSPKKPSSRDQSDEEPSDETSSKKAEPKVPPLKIVLTAPVSEKEDKKSPSGIKEEAKEAEKSTSKEVGDSTDAANLIPSSSATPDFDEDSSKGGNSNHSSTNTRLTRSRANQGTPGPGDQANDSPRDSSLNQCENANLEPPSKEPVATASTSSLGNQSNISTSNNINYTDYHVKKRKLRSQVDDIDPTASTSTSNINEVKNGQNKAAAATNRPQNDIEKYLGIRKQVEQRRKNLFPVFLSKLPEGFKDYLMNRKTYLLQGNAKERLRSIPMVQPPQSLGGPLKELFTKQEEERYKLRLKHVVEKEKLVLAVEQEILRVHGRAARAMVNQSLPYSVCTILRDEEIYTPIDPTQEEKNIDIRSRYNGRLFISWLQDVDDKWEKIKEQMVLRHHNEAESLNAVQKMDWEDLKKDIWTGGPGDSVPQTDDLHIPMVHVSEEFDLANA